MRDDQTLNLKLTLTYSLCYEKMMSKFFGRVDKLVSFLLLLSALAVVERSLDEVWLGVIIALLASFQFIYTPGQKHQAAKNQYLKYMALYHQYGSLDKEAVAEALGKLHETDTDGLGLLSHPARLAGYSMWGLDNASGIQERKMRLFEKALAHFVGEYPEFQFK